MQGAEQPLARGRLHPVPQPRVRRRPDRPRRLPLRLGRRRRQLRHRGLRAGQQPVSRRPGRTRAGRCAARTSGRRATRWASAARSSGSTRRTAPPPTGRSNNADRIVAYGQRNPWRLTFRPGTTELWSADVGGSAWEEINRLETWRRSARRSTAAGPATRARPAARSGSPAGTRSNKPVCENLYAAGDRRRAGAVLRLPDPRARCSRPASTARAAPRRSPVSRSRRRAANYPAAYQGSLFFSDYARAACGGWARSPTATRTRRASSRSSSTASTPVDLVAGPEGDLFYVDYGLDDGGVPEPRGRRHPPDRLPATRRPSPCSTADHISGPLSATYHFSAAGTHRPQRPPADLRLGPGRRRRPTRPAPAPCPRRRSLRRAGQRHGAVSRRPTTSGKSGTASLTVYPGNDPPVISDSMPRKSLRWRVGQKVRVLRGRRPTRRTVRWVPRPSTGR